MSAPIFPDIEQVMTVLMGEMPQGLFASDRADSPVIANRSYSSAEIRAHAQIYANMYENLLNIWENKFLSTVQPDGIGSWEHDLFSYPVDASQPFATRQQNALTKYRAQGGLSYPYIEGIVSSILTPQGLTFTLAVYSGMPTGAWILDVSPLDLDTYLAELDPLIGHIQGQYDLDCYAQIATSGTTVNTSLVVSGIPTIIAPHIEVGAGIVGAGIPNGTTVVSVGSNTVTMSAQATASHSAEAILIQNFIAAGLDQADFESIQATAYTYAVYIYGDADAMTLSTLDQTLTQLEMAGSTHVIVNNAVPPLDPNILDMGGGNECTLVDIFDCGNALEGATYNVWDFSL